MSAWLRVCLGALTAASLLSACQKAEAPPQAPLAVLVREVGEQGAEPLTIYTGEVRARHETDLSFRVGGKIVERHVEVGAGVRKGQPLARLDPQDLRLTAEAARDQLSAAEAELSLARAELERARQLVAQKFMSESVLDSRRTSVDAAEARVRQARAQFELSSNQATYSVLKADHDAVVLDVLADRGEVVAAGQPVLRLARQDEREVLIHVPEGRIGMIAAGVPAQVRPLADPTRSYGAQVREVAAAADAATRTFAVRLSVRGADEHLPLGASAVAGFVDKDARGMTLPLPAVIQRDGQSIVWSVDAEGIVQPVAVELLAIREDGALVGGGLQPGMKVVVAGTHRLTPGQRVRPMAEGAPVQLDVSR
ncbi:MAG: efflux RND transporter periplasmic adaptor subunit [Rhodocyclaceae bacterium]|nr:efflux RND transporter periplasmic adaptor subunit [Rhodocyclaceae bacterium]